MGQEGRGSRQRCRDDGAWLLGELFKTQSTGRSMLKISSSARRSSTVAVSSRVMQRFSIDDAQIDAVCVGDFHEIRTVFSAEVHTERIEVGQASRCPAVSLRADEDRRDACPRL